MNKATKIPLNTGYNCGAFDEHLCYITSQGFNLTDEHSYLALTRNPKFRCAHCGKLALCNRNMCVPMKL